MRTVLRYVVACVPWSIGYVVGTLWAITIVGYSNGFYRFFEEEGAE